jgi:fucose 4-O-acetylase-like acetyltransferase
MNKNSGIEACRTIAILLVLAFHVFHDIELEHVNYIYNYLDFMFQNIRLPLFTVISGYLLAQRPINNYTSFMCGKFRRLIIPMILVATIQYIATSVIPWAKSPTKLSQIYKIYYSSYDHFWFIQAVVLIFAFVGFVMSTRSVNLHVRIICLTILSILMFGSNSVMHITFMSIGGATYILPYFIIGYVYSIYNKYFTENNVKAIITILFCCAILLLQMTWSNYIELDTSKRSILGLIIGIICCLYFMNSNIKSELFSTAGKYVFSIYLYQDFGLTIGRHIGRHLLYISPHVYFISTVIVAVAFGVIVHIALSKNRFTSLLFLGQKYQKNSNRSVNDTVNDNVPLKLVV